MKFLTLKIKEIEEYINNIEDLVFMTFDIDWCSDDILLFTIDLIKKYKIKATLFITHHTDIIKDLSNDDNIEIGTHPNFNFLLNGNFKYGKNIKEIIEYFLEIFPNAVSVRSHSLTQNTYIHVMEHLRKNIPKLFLQVLSKLQENPNYVLEYQDESKALRTYPLMPEDARINWLESNEKIVRLINAFNKPYNGAFCFYKEQKLTIIKYNLVITYLN